MLSDEIHVGKTSAIIQWKKGKSNVFGIISPKENGNRNFEDAHSGETWPMKASETDMRILEVGQYRFSQSAFDRAFESLHIGFNFKGKRTVVFDEIGPLELRGSGFQKLLLDALSLNQIDADLNLLLVVRKPLLSQFFDAYQVANSEVFNVSEFSKKFLSG